MDDPLNRRMTVALLALLPLLLLIWASFRFVPGGTAEAMPMPGSAEGVLAQLASLPGSPSALPPTDFTLPLPGSSDPRAQNAAVPFVGGVLDPAPPYRFNGTDTDFANARDCLALAAMAEAGSSDPGQRAVIQVVLNRARHPAFANSVCGVVFEGSERATGCQFSFTCDGSLARQYDPASWAAARARAEQALKGFVFPAVGNATHYHTDWVFPWWSPKLQKIAQVETHLFLRWPGYWGSVRSWRKFYDAQGEPSLAALMARPSAAAPMAGLESLPATNLGMGPVAMPPLPSDTPAVTGGDVVMRLPSGKASFVTVAPAAGADSALAMARKLCPGEGSCRVMGWSDRSVIPAALPLTGAARAALQFSYARDPAGAEIVLYNCDTFTGQPREKCIPRAR
ncbi:MULTISPECIES: cell wall hydrolase [unclassified Novosphingobium]|uniref:cell wall hydrolase n=1 Tax=unclassified Novosphingobium TaxID=2644732 RepID=UPI0025E61D9F|nr:MULTISPECIES: cell wall hydrolase [unclassified Novosphingobium]HQV04654.1 cell wall hydrolase [Novosphingobium sp.]